MAGFPVSPGFEEQGSTMCQAQQELYEMMEYDVEILSCIHFLCYVNAVL